MEYIRLAAHFDGERILLDEPFELPKNAPLIVTVISPGVAAADAAWASTAAMGLSRAYGDDEPEYSVGDLK
jgi:hypothetical protein